MDIELSRESVADILRTIGRPGGERKGLTVNDLRTYAEHRETAQPAEAEQRAELVGQPLLPEQGLVFASREVREDVNLTPEQVERLSTGAQGSRLVEEIRQTLEDYGLADVTLRARGRWPDGGEASSALFLGDTDWDTLRAIAAEIAIRNKQKTALVTQAADDGNGVLLQLHTEKPHAEVERALAEHGFEFLTLFQETKRVHYR